MARSAEEYLFRIRQETSNIRLWMAPPEWPSGTSFGGDLPLPLATAVAPLIQGTGYEAELHAIAQRCAKGDLPAFGEWIEPGAEIRWRRDYRHGRETPLQYFRRIPYLDFSRAGDHKWIWEINRHQHLVALAQAWVLDRQPVYGTALEEQISSWLDANPPQLGINWTSALEVGLRALSWIWVLHLYGEAMPEEFRRRMLASLRAHGQHLAANLSIYFSPNTHLLGEALALYGLGRFLSALPEAAEWRSRGAHQVKHCLKHHVNQDGSYFEQSSYYHIYALDMFQLFWVWEGTPAPLELYKMAEFASALLGEDGRMPFLGDDDGGRLFHPFGPRNEFGRGTLAVSAALWGKAPAQASWLDREAMAPVAAWWLGAKAKDCWAASRGGPLASRLFASCGWATLHAKGVDAIVDAGPFGAGSGGHSHADTLSLTVRRGGREVVIDPGTYTYLADPAWRERFRAATAHGTVSVAGSPQATPENAFRWANVPSVRIVHWNSSPETDDLEAECEYGGIVHRRVVHFDKSGPRFWIADFVTGLPQGANVHINWPLAEAAESTGAGCFRSAGARIVVEQQAAKIGDGWRSPVLGKRQEAPILSVEAHETGGSCAHVTVIDWEPGEATVVASRTKDKIFIRLEDWRSVAVEIPLYGPEREATERE